MLSPCEKIWEEWSDIKEMITYLSHLTKISSAQCQGVGLASSAFPPLLPALVTQQKRGGLLRKGGSSLNMVCPQKSMLFFTKFHRLAGLIHLKFIFWQLTQAVHLKIALNAVSCFLRGLSFG